MEPERTHLIIDGNAVYEVDQECMNKGLNRTRKMEPMDIEHEKLGIKSYYPDSNNRKM